MAGFRLSAEGRAAEVDWTRLFVSMSIVHANEMVLAVGHGSAVDGQKF